MLMIYFYYFHGILVAFTDDISLQYVDSTWETIQEDNNLDLRLLNGVFQIVWLWMPRSCILHNININICGEFKKK